MRLTLDGEIPDDNPFVDQEGAAGAIWSYGHRNIQAMSQHPETGEIWVAEHGEAGGDEINIVQRGENFGWPLAAYGVDYRTGEQFADTPQPGDGFVAPVYHWPPGRDAHFPPSGMAWYEGDAFPDWQGHMLVGNLFHEYLGLFAVDGSEVSSPRRSSGRRGMADPRCRGGTGGRLHLRHRRRRIRAAPAAGSRRVSACCGGRCVTGTRTAGPDSLGVVLAGYGASRLVARAAAWLLVPLAAAFAVAVYLRLTPGGAYPFAAGWGFFGIAVANIGRHADVAVLALIGLSVLAGLWWRQRFRRPDVAVSRLTRDFDPNQRVATSTQTAHLARARKAPHP
jgi:hypothetical protein